MKRLRSLALLLAVTILSLAFCEIAVRLLIPVRNVGPSFSVYHPLYGMRLTTNSDGFRGPELDEPGRPAIVFVGDSFTMGYGVDDGEEFPALVRSRLAGERGGAVPVVNAGIGNTGNGHWLKFLRSEAARYAPRAVVLQAHANDFGDNVGEHLFRLEADGSLVESPVPPPGVGRRVQLFVEALPGLSHSYLVGLAKQMSWPRGAPPAAALATLPDAARQPDPGESLTLRLVEEAVRISVAQGWPVLLILVDVEPPRSTWLIERASNAGASVIQIPPKIERPDLYFEVDGHWTPAGHVFAADRILAYLRETTLTRSPVEVAR